MPDRFHGRKVLIVEDEYMLADDLGRFLAAHGAEVIGPAKTLEAGMLLASASALDCAVLDVNLRGESVLDLARLLDVKGVPIVFTTGYDQEVLPPELRRQRFVSKPLNLERLLSAVSDVFAADGDEGKMS
jgi:DNA-binding response OmpR family regulator